MPEMPRDIGWIQTASGGRFYPLAPRSEDVRIEDIAAALSRNCRFTGHCSKFYSVGEHSLLVAEILRRQGHSPDVQFWGLMHDASEAYISDIARPVKQQPEFQFYRDMEKGVMDAICERFDMDPTEPPEVKAADTLALAMEAELLMPLREKTKWAWLPAIPEDFAEVRLGEYEPGVVERSILAQFNRLESMRV